MYKSKWLNFILSNLLIWLVFQAFCFSQVVVEEVTTSDGFQGMGAFTSKSMMSISGDKQRKESETKFSGTLMKHFNPKGKTVEITRLDKEVIWNFNTEDKKYTEMTFAKIKEMLESGMPGPDAGAGEQEDTEADDDEYDWEKPVVKVDLRKTGNVNGYKCQNYLVTVMTVGTHRKTGVRDTMFFVSDLWNSVVKAKVMSELEDFNTRLAKQLGFDYSGGSGIANMLAAYKDQFKEMSQETGKLQGYPIKSTVNMSITNYAEKAQRGDSPESSEEDVDLTNLKGALGGMFGKKVKSMAKKESQAAGRKQVFQFTHEIKSIKEQAIPSDQFEVPAGYVKQAMPE
ncbi:hypothetical protein JXJ21_04825 [candidate division KSB1 bacterium]|nr:hypothetical protein [candidate division KSB1 bacterium]